MNVMMTDMENNSVFTVNQFNHWNHLYFSNSILPTHLIDFVVFHKETNGYFVAYFYDVYGFDSV